MLKLFIPYDITEVASSSQFDLVVGIYTLLGPICIRSEMVMGGWQSSWHENLPTFQADSLIPINLVDLVILVKLVNLAILAILVNLIIQVDLVKLVNQWWSAEFCNIYNTISNTSQYK